MTQESYFGFVARPFQAAPQNDFFVPLEPMVDVTERLVQAAVNGDGIGVLTAPPGAGKTVVCRELKARLDQDFLTVHLPSCSFPTRRAMLQAVLYELGCDYAGLTEQETRLKLLEAAQSILPDRSGLVIVADEAHQLSARLLEELRCLTNHVENGQPLIRVIVSGQLSLEELLTAPELQALNYRITCHTTLEPLSLQQSARYVHERLANVGGDAESLFSEEALEMVCRISDGNPRCLNQIADAALTHVAETGQVPIPASVIRHVLQDLKQLPLQWNESACDQLEDEDRHPEASLSGIAEDEAPGLGAGWQGFETGDDPQPETAATPSRHAAESPDSAAPEWLSQVATIEVGADEVQPADDRPMNDRGEGDIRAQADRSLGDFEIDVELSKTRPAFNDQQVPMPSPGPVIEFSTNPTIEIVAELTESAIEFSVDEQSSVSTLEAVPTPRTSHREEKHGQVLELELEELDVHDCYAALDRDSGASHGLETRDEIAASVDWTIGTNQSDKIAGPDDHRFDAEIPSSARSDLTALQDVNDQVPLEDRMDRVIQVVTDAVASEIAREQSLSHSDTVVDLVGRGLQRKADTTAWRSTPDPAAFDLIEPEPADHESWGDPSNPDSVESVKEAPFRIAENPIPESPQESALDPASEDLGSAHDDSARIGEESRSPNGTERPYARLFSRARRSRVRA